MTIIGLKRGTVILKRHHKEWAEAFEIEKKLLINLLSNKAINIEHIGSTAISGLAAKPIIDMLMGIKSLAAIADIRPLLENVGYEYRGNGSNDVQVLFAKGPEELRTHYLHITEFGNSVWRDNLIFRDYMRAHAEAVAEYEKLKQALAKQCALDRESYTAAKNSFIQAVLEKARI